MNHPQLFNLILPIIYSISILLSVAFLTLIERKLMGYMQSRKGPNTVGPQGLLQPLADGMKLFIKEPIHPLSSFSMLFILSPTLALTLALSMWLPLPMPYPLADLNMGLLFMISLSSLMVYSILWAGWASNSKYALMGALRAVAQTISYEITLGIILLSVALFSGGFNLQMFIMTQKPMYLMFSSWPLMMMWYISTLAETNRAPFDLTEGESELVSGFNVEYAAGPFALFFLTEYANILMMNTLSTIMFLSSPKTNTPQSFSLSLMSKTMLLSLGFLWIRASYPRFRYDQLMHLLWKNFLPMTMAICLWHISMLITFASLPPTL